MFPHQLLHEYWMTLRNRVSAVDELAMATERLRVRHPKEPKPNPPVHHIIEPHEVVENRSQESPQQKSKIYNRHKAKAAMSSSNSYCHKNGQFHSYVIHA